MKIYYFVKYIYMKYTKLRNYIILTNTNENILLLKKNIWSYIFLKLHMKINFPEKYILNNIILEAYIIVVNVTADVRSGSEDPFLPTSLVLVEPALILLELHRSSFGQPSYSFHYIWSTLIFIPSWRAVTVRKGPHSDAS